MLQRIALLFVTLAGLQAFALNLPEFAGTYNFNANGVQLQQQQHRLTILRQSADSINYIGQLQANGYTCQAKANQRYYCVRFERNMQENTVVRNSLIEKFQGTKIEFATPQTAYQQILNSSALQEYLRLQNSRFLNKNFNRVTLFVLPSITKIELSTNNTTEVEYLVYRDINVLGRMQTVIKAERPQASFVTDEDRLYLYEVAFVRN